MSTILNPHIVNISEDLKQVFLDGRKSFNEISIFLCGGGSLEDSKFRKEVGVRISKTISKYKYSVHYPEDIFIDLILGHQKQNLLTLENLLADSVNAIVILLQSPGTFTELGAFTNYEKLRDKLIVVINPKYARSKSFINLGPIRYLKANTKSKVLSISMDSKNIDNLAKQISDNAREIAKHSLPLRDLSNPISAYVFYLALIYVFDPIPKNAIFSISKSISDKTETILNIAAETVINSLVNERKVFLSSGNISITSKGIDDLIYGGQTKRKSRVISEILSTFRLTALNLTLRKTHKNVWGEAEES
jgi:hypothetical protein